MTEASSIVYDLTAESMKVALKTEQGNKVFDIVHVLRQPTFEEWSDYVKTRNFVGFSKGKDTFEFANLNQEDDAEFWSTLVQKVEGYIYGGKDLMERSDWKDFLPLNHKLEAISAILTFSKVEIPMEDKVKSEGFDLSDTTGAVITFESIFGSVRPIIAFSFSIPKTEDYIRYNRFNSKTQLVRGKQKGVSAIKMPVNISVFVSLFDNLCIKAEGYKFKGQDWKNEIPLIHKQSAVRALFTSSLQMEEDGGSD